MTAAPTHPKDVSRQALHSLVHAHPLATWVVQGRSTLLVNHIPFWLDTERGEHGTLVGHVARANPVWQQLPDSAGVAVFQGPQASVPRPRHGHTHAPHGDYAVVHVHGVAHSFDSREQLRALVTRLTARHTGNTPAGLDSMLNAIVGIEIPVQRWVSQWKSGRDRPRDGHDGVTASR
jgi:transcriptional regulator